MVGLDSEQYAENVGGEHVTEADLYAKIIIYSIVLYIKDEEYKLHIRNFSL